VADKKREEGLNDAKRTKMITTKQTERTPLLLDVPAAGPFTAAPQLLPGSNDDEEAATPPPSKLQPPSVPVTTIVLVLLIGVMVSNADASFVTATHTVIASEFGALHDSSWLLTGFVLASAVTQPLVRSVYSIAFRFRGDEVELREWWNILFFCLR
jgi:hypothetical protein